MTILEKLWYGNLCPFKSEDYRTEEFRELEALVEYNEKRLLPTLTQTQQENYEKIKGQWEEMDCILEFTAFKLGFSLAMQLMAAAVP